MSTHHASAQLGSESIGKLLYRFALPSITGMVVGALYHVVGRAYLSRVADADALAGMTLTFPVMTVIMAFGMLVGIGTGALISISLGRGQREDAEKCLGQAVALFFLMYAVLSPLAFVFMDEILNALGAKPDMLPYAKQYLTIILAGNIVQHLSFGLNNAIRAEGFPGRALATQLIGAGLNIIVDPFLIFPEFLNLGVRGAAWGAVISQSVSAAWVLAHFMSPKSACRLRWKNIRIHPPLALKMAGIGLAPFTTQFVASIVLAVFNLSFRHYADDNCELYIATMGTVQAITMLFFMPVFGLTHALQPIVGYNYGAHNYERVRHAYNLTLKVAIAFGICGALFCWLGAQPLAHLFAPKNNPQLAELRAILPHYLRVMTLIFPVVGFSITTSQYFMSIGKTALALATTLLRQVVFLLPALLILPRFFGIEGIWYATPVSDFGSLAVALILFCHEQKHLRKLIQQ